MWAFLVLWTAGVEGAVLCVWTNSPHPGLPYNDWTNAARVIQEAVSAASSGDVVLVRAGMYQEGGGVAQGALTNRVALTNAIVLASESGPEGTTIVGRGGMGDAAVRCAYVGSNAVLSGFTLSNGHTRISGDATLERSGGGAWCEPGGVLTNCVVRNGRAQFYAGGVYQGRLYNCWLELNRGGLRGGGSYSAHSWDCVFQANMATNGGAAAYGLHTRAVMCVNTAVQYGGAVYDGTVVDSTVASNEVAGSGGGLYLGRASGCRIAHNRAGGGGGGVYQTVSEQCWILNNVSTNSHGGGAYQGAHISSFVAGNRAAANGGGVYEGSLTNCTVVMNHACWKGGGAYADGSPAVVVANSILYYNTAGDQGANYVQAEDYLWTNCCTEPALGTGGSFSNPPGLISLFNPHLATNSVCREAGWLGMAGGTNDVDGEPRLNGAFVDVGCDEVWPAGLTGALSVAFSVPSTGVVAGFALCFQADIQGKASSYEWAWGDGTVTPGDPWPCHVFSTAGVYAVVLSAWNAEGFVSYTSDVQVLGGYTNYAALSGSSTPPFDSWATAATNIQDAIEANPVLGSRVLVGEGVYSNGFVVTNNARCRVSVWKPLRVTASNASPGATVILGSGRFASTAVRGVYLGQNASLEGFTVSNGFTRMDGDSLTARSGGGVWCEPGAVLSNCAIRGNGAEYYGGGVYRGTLYDCLVAGNVASNGGGGLYQSEAHRTVIQGNTSSSGGGGFQGLAQDCLILSNRVDYYGAGYYQGSFQRCRVLGNRASNHGGGSYQTAAYNSLYSGNEAAQQGGGAALGELVNCTVVKNSAGDGGGVYGTALRNSIVYYNQATVAGMNYTTNYAFSAGHSCSTPLLDGPGNVSSEPGLASFLNPSLVSNSVCRQAGSNEWAVGETDLHGNPRVQGGRVDVGCVEYDFALWTGALSSAFSLPLTNLVAGYSLSFESGLSGRALEYVWQWGDGQAEADRPALTHAYASPGTYAVVLSARNNSGLSQQTVTVHVVGGYTNYVSLAGGNVPPYESWADAAHAIQDAIDANRVAGGVVLLASGVYTQGWHVKNNMTNRFGLEKPLTVMGVDRDSTLVMGRGPSGASAIRCAYVGAEGRLASLTLTGGCTKIDGDVVFERSGGGAWCEPGAVISHCVIAGNACHRYGAGVYGGEVRYSRFIANTSSYYGGGAYQSTVADSSFEGNMAWVGGGAYGGVLSGCVFHANLALTSGDGGALAYAQATHCAFSNNFAADGGAAYRSDLVFCFLAANTGGMGGAMNQGRLLHGTAVLNRATGEGGAFYRTTFSNVLCLGNSSARNGGALSSGYGWNARILSNWAGGHGGGLAGVTAQYCEVAGNIAVSNGGGVYGGVLQVSEIAGNAAGRFGGGGYDALLYRCRVVQNGSSNSGGGVCYGALTNCLVVRNVSGGQGGGAQSARLFHSTVCQNRAATNSGGAYNCVVAYSICCSNWVGTDAANYSNCTFSYSCTAPAVAGIGNISDDPALANPAGDDYHLTLGSPCIDLTGVLSGLPADLEGRPRPLDGDADGTARPDMGAYEFLNALADTDGDHFRDGDELVAGTDLMDAESFLGLVSMSRAPPAGWVVRWQSVAGKQYSLERSTNLLEAAGFTNCFTGVAGWEGHTAITDSTAAAGSPCFYRVGVMP